MKLPKLKGQSIGAWKKWLQKHKGVEYNPTDAKNQIEYTLDAFLELIDWALAQTLTK